jgi:hypothetical protein
MLQLFHIPESRIWNSWYNTLVLAPVDVYILIKVATLSGGRDWVQASLASDLGVSPSVVNRALKKAEAVGLYSSHRRSVNVRNLVEALVHGSRFFLAPERGGEVRGQPTAWSAPSLRQELVGGELMPLVWPDPEGQVRGTSLAPLHPRAPWASRRDAAFYKALALVDVLRVGGAKERAAAERLLGDVISPGEEAIETSATH